MYDVTKRRILWYIYEDKRDWGTYFSKPVTLIDGLIKPRAIFTDGCRFGSWKSAYAANGFGLWGQALVWDSYLNRNDPRRPTDLPDGYENRDLISQLGNYLKALDFPGKVATEKSQNYGGTKFTKTTWEFNKAGTYNTGYTSWSMGSLAQIAYGTIHQGY